MTRLAALCDALRARGAMVLIQSKSTMRVRGPDLEVLAAEIKYWKPELISGLYSANGAEPFACCRCGCEVVPTPATECLWCAALPDRALEIRPNSTAEMAFLARAERCAKASQLSQASQPTEMGNFPKICPSAEAHAA